MDDCSMAVWAVNRTVARSASLLTPSPTTWLAPGTNRLAASQPAAHHFTLPERTSVTAYESRGPYTRSVCTGSLRRLGNAARLVRFLALIQKKKGLCAG